MLRNLKGHGQMMTSRWGKWMYLMPLIGLILPAIWRKHLKN